MTALLRILAGGLLFAGLAVPVAGAGPAMEIHFAVVDPDSAEVSVRILVEDPGAEVRALRGVPTYVDNPHAAAVGEILRGLRVERGGDAVPVRAGLTERGEPVWVVESSAGTLEVEYRLRVDFEAGALAGRYPIHVPEYRDGRAWLSGNHVFLTPEFSDDRVADLRRSLPVRLRFELDDQELHGPPADVILANLHELLSLQFGIGDFEELRAGGEDWAGRVILGDPQWFTDAERRVLVTEMATMCDATVELFKGAPFDTVSLFVFRDEGLGGLEGSWAAQAYLPADVDLEDDRDPRTAIFFQVALHELVHTWIPIAVFTPDDPWFKEGVTSHYGHVLAARTGLSGPAEVARIFDRYGEMVFGEVELEEVALGEREIWHREYDGENWRRLTYERGHAVALLLDVHLRERSEHRHSLDDVMRELFASRNSEGFDRPGLLAAIETATGVDATGFFADYVDDTRAPPVEAVDAALRSAIRYGVYDEK